MADSVSQWLRNGALIPDAKLEGELSLLSYATIPHKQMRSQLTPRNELARILKRSPDRYSAFALAVWRPPSWSELHNAPQSELTVTPIDGYQAMDAVEMDPYADMP
jgi:hypothetical protein